MIKQLDKKILGGGKIYISGSAVNKLFKKSSRETLILEKKGITFTKPFPKKAIELMKKGHEFEPIILKEYERVHNCKLITKWNTIVDTEKRVSGTFDAIQIDDKKKIIKVVDAKYSKTTLKQLQTNYLNQLNLYMYLAKGYYSKLIEEGYKIESSLYVFDYVKNLYHEVEHKYDSLIIVEMLMKIKEFWNDYDGFVENIAIKDSKCSEYLDIKDKLYNLSIDVKTLNKQKSEIWKEIGIKNESEYNSNYIVKKGSFTTKRFDAKKWELYCELNNIDTEDFYKETISSRPNIIVREDN